ncbi:MAG: oligosaccharide flippase family protein [Dethiobacteraceae bacterium]
MFYVMAIAQHLFPLLTFPYLTRVLEPSLYGVITYMTAVSSYVRIFINFGFDLSSTKEIAENKSNKDHVERILSSTLQAKLILALISLLFFNILIQFVPIISNNILISYLYFLGVVLEISLPDFLFRGLEKMGAITLRYIVSKSVSTILTFVLIRSKNDAVWVPLLNIAGTLVASFLIWFQIKNNIGLRFIVSSWVNSFKRLKESFIYFISTFATTAFGVTNTFLLGVFDLSAEQISYWGVSYNLINSALSLYAPIINSLYPHMVTKKDIKLMKILLYLLMPAIILTTIIVYIFADKIIIILCGIKYVAAVPILRALLPVLIFSFPAQLIGFPLLGTIGRVREITKSTVISAIWHINMILILVGIGKFTILNMAIVRSVTEIVLFGIRAFFLWTHKRQKGIFYE